MGIWKGILRSLGRCSLVLCWGCVSTTSTSSSTSTSPTTSRPASAESRLSERPPEDAAEAGLPSIRAADVITLEITGELGNIRLVRQEAGWRLGSPVVDRADAAAVATALEKLETIEARIRVTDDPEHHE